MKTTSGTSCKTAAVMGLLSRGPSAPAPAGGDAPAPAKRTVEEITSDILRAKQAGGEAVLSIGRGLIEAKAVLPHGEWLPWLNEKVEFSERSAQNFMRLAREWSNPQALADLGAAKALTLLALPETERAAFAAEAHLVDGEEKTVIDMTSRQLEQAVRERAEALEAKERAEADRAKLEADAALLKQTLEGVQQDRDAALRDAETRQAALLEYEKTADRLTRELEELKNRPVEVAVEVDQEAVAKARAEGEAAKSKELAALQEKLDKEKEKAKKLKADLDAAAQGRAHAESALGEAQARLAAAAQPEKPSLLTADAELAQFKLLFEQAQGLVKQMRELLLNLRTREDGAAAGKLEQALVALSEKVRGCVQ